MESMVLNGIEAIHLATVLEDCVDQLAVLGRIMPVAYDDRADAEELVNDELAQLSDSQKMLENKYESIVNQKENVKGGGKAKADKRAELARETAERGKELKTNMQVFARGLKQSPLTPDNLEKVQADRAFLQRVLGGTLLEISQNGTFQTLVDAVESEKKKKAGLQQIIRKEEEGRKRVRMLQRQIVEVRKEKETELEQRNEMIAHLKDQLQEMKAKTNMEGKYIKKCAEVSVSQTQKKCQMSEKDQKNEIEQLKVEIDEETRVNAEIESYLRTHSTELQEKLEFWIEKYEKDTEAKQRELDILKGSKAKDLERLQELTRLYGEYEQVVVEDRIEKEKARRKTEMEAEELEAAVRIQAWYQGVMVRCCLGPYAKKKKKGKK